MAKRRTDQEWKNLFEQYESSQLSQRVFCERHGLSVSTFYAKRQQLQCSDTQGGRLTGADIHAYIVKEFGQHYHPDSIYYLLDHMGFSWITSRSKHPKQSQEVQDDFKKIQN